MSDKVSVVKCGECKYYQQNQCLFWCDLNSYMEPLPTNANDYCSKGKTKGEITQVKVIQRGRFQHFEYKFKCKNCKSILQSKLSELKYDGSQYNTAYYSYICPICKTKQFTDSDVWERIEVDEEG